MGTYHIYTEQDEDVMKKSIVQLIGRQKDIALDLLSMMDEKKTGEINIELLPALFQELELDL